ncbi:hypothetical protein [Erythrobacter crassostreae]|uniref:Uncharacterized protein n=1 Tax=Erythrobacter crassostreae TaxID=2828328 RepID=A0A9X1F662_9SPHN|nr:hypothetical protein [Erythrobacter crassostrea]MBV7260013.1 hypothetical protein [Erythrobacter crassostrea]
MAFLGSYAVGFPIALLVYFLAGEQLARWPSTIFVIGVLSAVMITLASFTLADRYAALLFGGGSLFAALTYATLGWFWVIKPQQEALLAKA